MTAVDFPVRFDSDGLVPAVIQDAVSAEVLMLGFMNADALDATRRTGKVHFWSRSRGKLWRKGETSGHEQLVEEILVNCEQNSLLLKVRQIGAVCHDGFSSCYYRRLEEDRSLTVVRERAFDPADVYLDSAAGIATQSRRWYGAYEYLRDNDLATTSNTSKLLRSGSSTLERIGDELAELAGVLDGSHTHDDRDADVVLEGSQLLYWIAVGAVARGFTWDDLRLDRALATGADNVTAASCARLLLAEAKRWRADQTTTPEELHAVTALVAQASRSADVSPQRLIEADLADLRGRPYLSPYFERPDS
ncbi:MAG: phosphoribosyl-AMP cyclohydrolase [Thermomicrobiales bacterium]